MKVHQRGVTREIVIGGIDTKVGVGNGRARHVQRVNNLLKIRGGSTRENVIGEYDEGLDEGKEKQTHCIFNQRNQQVT